MRVVLAAVTLGLCALGCSTPKVKLDEGPREYVATDYESVLKSWTRDKQFTNVNVMDNVLSVTATYESWDFRWAYVVRYAQDYQLPIEQRRVLLDSTLAETRSHHQFYVALYGGNRRWTDLSKTSTAWIVRLLDDRGNETAPEEITAIPKPGAIERTYFPYTSVWRQAFRIKFPASSAKGPTI